MSGDRGWQLVVPIKRAELGKSRLIPPLGISRPDLARAMASDALAVAAHVLGPGAVLVVTSDEPMRTYAESLGMGSLSDPGGGLNAAIALGFAHARTSSLAVLLPDVPALKNHELQHALTLAEPHAVAMVADHTGTGTCLLTSRQGPIATLFGDGSAHRHREGLGAVHLSVQAPGLRQDVDTAADLDSAMALGLGPATIALLQR